MQANGGVTVDVSHSFYVGGELSQILSRGCD